MKSKRATPADVLDLIDENWYLETYADVSAAGATAAIHYMTVGWAEGRNPNRFFDTDWYFKQNPDVEESGISPLTHYVQYGWREGRDPHPCFDTSWYLEQYTDVAGAGVIPLTHFLLTGRSEGRTCCEACYQKQSLVETHPPPLPEPPPQAAGITPSVDKPPAPIVEEPERKCFFDVTETLTTDEIINLIRSKDNPSTAEAKVTVVIPVYKNLEYTLRCVTSVLTSSDSTTRKIIIVDDKSPDGSGAWLQQQLAGLQSIRVKINPVNLGFLRSCNAAIETVKTDYVFLLNNDTFVLDGWLDELVGVLERYPDCGLAGSKLLYPDGRLQEAGGIIWNGAGGANFGRNQDAWKPEFNYQRDVDYISGAAIMTPTRVWKELGGFSDEFTPAYYEDTDYAMKVRQMGYRVIYQPLSSVIHFEGASSGTDLTQGVKRYQVINQKKFESKWASELATAGDHADFSRHIVDRKTRGRILIFDNETPRPDKDSGSVTAFQYMKILTELGMRVTFLPQNLLWTNKHSRALQRIGVEVLFAPYVTDARQYLLDHAGEFDILMLSRAPIGGLLIDDLRQRYPNIPIIFDTVDLHHLRMFRHYDLEQDWALWEAAAEMKRIELNAIRKSNVTLLVSHQEAQYLYDEIGPVPNVVLPLIYEDHEPRTMFSERKDVAFVGGFRHTPNIDSVRYLVEEIWPLVRQAKTGAKLHIIGSHMPKDFSKFACEDIIVVGYVEELEPYLENIRLSVAPLRYGAGVKGKVGNSLRMGIPVVGTPVAFEGMGLQDGIHVRRGTTAHEIATAIAELYTNQSSWERLSATGRAYVMERFGVSAAKKTLNSIVQGLLKPY